MDYQIPVEGEGGCWIRYKDKHGRDWLGVICWIDAGLGAELVLLFDNNGTWEKLTTIAGPYWGTGYVEEVQAAGGLGAWQVQRRPLVQKAIDRFFDPTPTLPDITNQTDPSIANSNILLAEWFKATPDPTDTNAPTFDVHAPGSP